MKFDVWGKTDVGLKREINQDSILVDKELGIYIVADGMGGHKGGEVASALAVETVCEVVRDHKSKGDHLDPRALLEHAYSEASSRIHHKSTHENPELMGMGTTMVVALLDGNRLYIGNVGDSRAYLYANNNLWLLTEDHSLVYEQIKAGVIREEDEANMVGRNVITRSVGFEKEVEVDVIVREVSEGEVFLICSDGLSGMISNQAILNIFQAKSLEKVVGTCIKEAKIAGGDDNVSVVVLRAKADE